VKVRQIFTPVWCLKRSEGMIVGVKECRTENSSKISDSKVHFEEVFLA
jgi:hypothetical protein